MSDWLEKRVADAVEREAGRRVRALEAEIALLTQLYQQDTALIAKQRDEISRLRGQLGEPTPVLGAELSARVAEFRGVA